jgi:hypothetical protein
MNLLKNKHWVGIHREAEGEEDRNKPGKGPSWRKRENAAIHGANLGNRRTGNRVR